LGGLERDGLMVYLDLGGEVLHDGADELGFVGCETGGFGAWGCGSCVVVHGCGIGGGVWFVREKRGFGECLQSRRGGYPEREDEGAMECVRT
jgi:hypothetical protein